MKKLLSSFRYNFLTSKRSGQIPRADIEGFQFSKYPKTPGNGKIFGIGLSKTGTTSLFYALGLLGYRSITYRHVRRRGIERWLDGDFSVDYFADIDAATDLPLGSFYRNLDLAYPGSKFILTVREKSGWLKSIEHQFTNNPDPGDFGRFTRIAAYGHRIFNFEEFSYRYDEHFKGVTQYFKDRESDLLILDVSEPHKWERLLSFLKYPNPQPEIDYPNRKPGSRPPDQALFHTTIFGSQLTYLFTTQALLESSSNQDSRSFVEPLKLLQDTDKIFTSALIMVDEVPCLDSLELENVLICSLERIYKPDSLSNLSLEIIIGIIIQTLLSKTTGVIVVDPITTINQELFDEIKLNSSAVSGNAPENSVGKLIVENHSASDKLKKNLAIQNLYKSVALDLLSQKDSVQCHGIYRVGPMVGEYLTKLRSVHIHDFLEMTLQR